MDVQITRSGGTYLYDSQRDVRDTTMIKDLTGATAMSGNYLAVNNADMVTYAAFNKCRVEIGLTVPVAPVAGQSKVFGLKLAIGGVKGAAVFMIADDVFYARVYEKDGSDYIFSKTIPWLSAWTNTDTRYQITVSEDCIIFLIDDVVVARFNQNNKVLSKQFYCGPLPVRITNGNADALLLSTISAY